VRQFFAHLVKLLEGGKRVSFEDVLAIARKHIIRVPGYLPLTSRCFGMMDREIPLATAIAFKARIALALGTAGAGLERHFRALEPGGGATLLLNSYGLIVGLWQLMHPNERFGSALERPELRILKRDYERDVEAALRALWTGSLGVKALKEKSP
jgi:hypothetical protein